MKTNYKNRVVLISDMHYTTEKTDREFKSIYPDAKVSPASGNAFGYTQTEKIDCILNDLSKFMESKTVHAVLILGDLSIDDYGFRNLPENYCEKFKEHCMAKFPCLSYAIPGNHDSYPNAMWKELFGYNRQYSVKICGAVFIMLDTFNSTPAATASGSPYTGIDLDFLERELQKYPTEQIFLCSHYINTLAYDEKLIELLNKNRRIVCLFDAHTHVNRIHLANDRIQQYQINVGGYGYKGEKREDGKWYFDKFHESWAWGYEVLEWNETKAHVYHVKPNRRYFGSSGEVYYPGAIEDELVIEF